MRAGAGQLVALVGLLVSGLVFALGRGGRRRAERRHALRGEGVLLLAGLGVEQHRLRRLHRLGQRLVRAGLGTPAGAARRDGGRGVALGTLPGDRPPRHDELVRLVRGLLELLRLPGLRLGLRRLRALLGRGDGRRRRGRGLRGRALRQRRQVLRRVLGHSRRGHRGGDRAQPLAAQLVQCGAAGGLRRDRCGGRGRLRGGDPAARRRHALLPGRRGTRGGRAGRRTRRVRLLIRLRLVHRHTLIRTLGAVGRGRGLLRWLGLARRAAAGAALGQRGRSRHRLRGHRGTLRLRRTHRGRRLAGPRRRGRPGGGTGQRVELLLRITELIRVLRQRHAVLRGRAAGRRGLPLSLLQGLRLLRGGRGGRRHLVVLGRAAVVEREELRGRRVVSGRHPRNAARCDAGGRSGLLRAGPEHGLRVAHAAAGHPRRVLRHARLTRHRPPRRLRPAGPCGRGGRRGLKALRVELVAELVGAGHRASSFLRPQRSRAIGAAAEAFSPRRPVRT